MKAEYVQIGNLKKTFGNNGDISFRLFSENVVVLEEGLAIFLYLDGIYVPFFVGRNNTEKKSVLHLDDVDTLKEAEGLAGKEIFLKEEDVESDILPIEELEFGYLKGFSLKNQEGKEIGIINEIASYPMQEMAVLKNNVLIPLNHRLIIDIDKENKVFHYQIIEGLID